MNVLAIMFPIIPPAWSVRSIDTMKFSRDEARRALTDPAFDEIIDTQIRAITSVNPTHIAIDTPYDEEFLPVLRRWVHAVRISGLKVWFRGNFSGWEEWFGYPRIDRAEHLRKTWEFLKSNQDLFEDGDIFTACPECENGGPGDPRSNDDLAGHRSFLLDEYYLTKRAFPQGKQVATNFNSMNADVARLVMDRPMTDAMGGLVVVDHYVSSSEQLADDIKEIAALTHGKVMLGETGVPVPAIHGPMTSHEQAGWLRRALMRLRTIPELIGMNYWVSFGGTTAIWRDEETELPAVDVLRQFYNASTTRGFPPIP